MIFGWDRPQNMRTRGAIQACRVSDFARTWGSPRSGSATAADWRRPRQRRRTIRPVRCRGIWSCVVRRWFSSSQRPHREGASCAGQSRSAGDYCFERQAAVHGAQFIDEVARVIALVGAKPVGRSARGAIMARAVVRSA